MAIWCEGVFRRYRGVLRRARESGTASRTSKRLDPLGMAMLAISHQSVDSSVSDAKVWALRVRTGEALGVYPVLAPWGIRSGNQHHACD
jgi:hypothetical protein